MYIYVAAISIFLTLLTILIIFAFPQISPIPYFPSNKKDLPLIIKALSLKNNQTIIDLGAGDGIVVFEAAEAALKKRLNTKFMAVELNPVLVVIMQLRRLFHPNKRNIQIVRGDMFKFNARDLAMGGTLRSADANFSRLGGGAGTNTTTEQKDLTSSNLTFYLYISPWYLEKVFRIIKNSHKKFTLVSYFYSLPKTVRRPDNHIKGVHDIFIYNIS